MNLLDNPFYVEDIKYVAGLELPWDQLKNTKVLISGATGLIGTFLVDVLMQRSLLRGMNCRIYAMGRDRDMAKKRFIKYWDNEDFHFMPHDINHALGGVTDEKFDYIIHLASNTHPIAYSSSPISTITTNVIGSNNLLSYAALHGCRRFIFASSNEVYGENRGDTEVFDEKYCGYTDCNTLRAGYPESKRCGEALCQAYLREKGVDVVIPRLTRSYGPTMLMSDTKAISQFIKNAINGQDIVLKSAGTQYYSYTYAADATAGLLTVMLCGKTGEAYNIADSKSDIMLKDLARLVADACHTKVVFEIPDDAERAGYSTATKARLDGSKAKALGWDMRYDIGRGIRRTIEILRDR